MGVAILSGVIESLQKLKDSQPSESARQAPALDDSYPDAQMPLGDSTPNRFITCVSRPESARKLKKRWLDLGREDIEVRVSDNVRGVAECDVILLGYVLRSYRRFSLCKSNRIIDSALAPQIWRCSCKPQMAKDVLGAPGMHEALSNKLLISILAGTTTSQLRSFVPSSTRVVRAMPNTPCQVSPNSSLCFEEFMITDCEL